MPGIRLGNQDLEVLHAAKSRGVWYCVQTSEWLMLKAAKPKRDMDAAERALSDMPVEHNITASVRNLKNLGLLESREVSQVLDVEGIPSYARSVQQKQYKTILALLTPAGRATITPQPIKRQQEQATRA